jgi:hypothetical protein
VSFAGFVRPFNKMRFEAETQHRLPKDAIGTIAIAFAKFLSAGTCPLASAAVEVLGRVGVIAPVLAMYPPASYRSFAGAPGTTAGTFSGLMLKAKNVNGSSVRFPHWWTRPNGS